MSISIVACPKCGTFLLNDSAQCHRCRHVINEERATQFRDTSLPTDAAIAQDMDRCRQCGETCRKGLVRCWSCGAFTRPEIEAAYYRLLQGHSTTVNSANQKYELPEISAEEGRRIWGKEDRPAAPSVSAQSSETAAVDDDFELTGNLRLLEDAPTLGIDVSEAEPPPAIPNLDESIVKAPEPIALAPAAPVKAEPAIAAPANAAPAAAAKPAAAATPPADDPDALLSIAKQQETDVQKSRRAKLGEGFVIFCPMGCKIRVQERHRGKIGRCPKCNATFVVPMAKQTSVSGSMPPGVGENAAAAASAGAPAGGQKYGTWMQDIHLHKVAPEKLRIKADSLLKEFQEVDLAFDAACLLMLSYPAGGGMFGGKDPKKKTAARTAAAEHLAAKGTVDDLPASFKHEFTRDTINAISLTQPAGPGTESLFGNILVFGAGRVAVRLPKFDEKTTGYLSFSLSQFREFSRRLAEFYGIESFGSGAGIPMQDEYQETPCYFTKKPVKELKNLLWYDKDPSIKREISGYRCKLCQTVISENARAGQKLGGPDGKGIAKVKCPKCSKPLGKQLLYKVAVVTEKPAETGEAAAAEPAAEKTPETTAV